MDHDRIDEIRERTVRIESKLEGTNQRLDRMNGHVAAHEERLDDQERKLGDVKTKVKVGIAVLVGGLLGSRPELIEKLIQALAD